MNADLNAEAQRAVVKTKNRPLSGFAFFISTPDLDPTPAHGGVGAKTIRNPKYLSLVSGLSK
jgi:hypothetical protein